mgnify:CR=1 FL=1
MADVFGNDSAVDPRMDDVLHPADVTILGVGNVILRDEGFVLRREEEVPLVIREHARKYQFIVTHGMLWQRER